MKHETQTIAKWGVILALCALADEASAQSLFGNGQRYYSGYDYSVISGLLRLFTIAISTGAGFVIGWFFSPSARELRRALLILAGVIAVGVVLLSNGGLSWGLASLMALLGFFWGIGFWLGQAVKSLMVPPTTFGSAMWADIAHLIKKNLIGSDGIILGRVFDGIEEKMIS